MKCKRRILAMSVEPSPLAEGRELKYNPHGTSDRPILSPLAEGRELK